MSDLCEIKMTEIKEKYSVAKAQTNMYLDITSKLFPVLMDSSYISPIFFAKTPDEFSMIMPSAKLYDMNLDTEKICIDNSWACFKVIGPMPFDLVGIMAKLSKILADASISLLAQSTFETDYILVKWENRDATHRAFTSAGVKFL